jgi:Flp pilus assembly protein TadD
VYDAALQHSPNDPGFLYRRGSLEHRAGRPEAAIPYLQRCVDTDPAHRGANIALGCAHLRDGDPLRAVAVLMPASRQWPNDGEVHEALGVALAGAQRHGEALKALQRALQLGHETAGVHFAIGDCALFRGDQKYAQAALERALALDPRHARAATRLGTIAMMRGRVVDAVRMLQHAVAIDPSHAGARFELVMAHLKMQRLDLAHQEYEALSRLDSELAARVRALFPA